MELRIAWLGADRIPLSQHAAALHRVADVLQVSFEHDEPTNWPADASERSGSWGTNCPRFGIVCVVLWQSHSHQMPTGKPRDSPKRHSHRKHKHTHTRNHKCLDVCTWHIQLTSVFRCCCCSYSSEHIFLVILGLSLPADKHDRRAQQFAFAEHTNPCKCLRHFFHAVQNRIHVRVSLRLPFENQVSVFLFGKRNANTAGIFQPGVFVAVHKLYTVYCIQLWTEIQI